MQDLTSTVRDYILDNTDVELEEVYQVFQHCNTRITAEIRIAGDVEAIAIISPFKTIVKPVENGKKEFLKLVESSNQIGR